MSRYIGRPAEEVEFHANICGIYSIALTSASDALEETNSLPWEEGECQLVDQAFHRLQGYLSAPRSPANAQLLRNSYLEVAACLPRRGARDVALRMDQLYRGQLGRSWAYSNPHQEGANSHNFRAASMPGGVLLGPRGSPQSLGMESRESFTSSPSGSYHGNSPFAGNQADSPSFLRRSQERSSPGRGDWEPRYIEPPGMDGRSTSSPSLFEPGFPQAPPQRPHFAQRVPICHSDPVVAVSHSQWPPLPRSSVNGRQARSTLEQLTSSFTL